MAVEQRQGDGVDPADPAVAPAAAGDAAGPTAVGSTGFLLNQPAGPAQHRRALGVLLASALVFAAIAPWATYKLPPMAAFIPIYESALLITDLITAVLLFGQYRILRSRALLVLGSGYLFSAAMTVGHALSFPGLFAPTGWLGAGPQSTAWIYMLWHSGFPLFVLAYVWLKRAPSAGTPAKTAHARLVASAVPLSALLLGIALVALATAGQSLLPAIMQDNHYTPAMRGTVFSVWLFSAAALVALWRQRPHSVLDLWLMVVTCVWLFDIALSAMLNAGRYDAGFYAGRIYGLLASSVVLLELLLENGMLYAQLVGLHESEHRRAEELALAHHQAQAANAAKGLFLASMSHEIRTPMNAIIGLTQLVLETELAEQQRDYLSKVQISSKALLGLLNDILDYSKIEAGKVSLEAEEFSPEETIENVGNLFSARIEEGGLDLVFEIGDDIPQRLLGDSLRLTQVLNNLVGNAIKFTPRGEIVIGVETVSRGDAQVVLRFSVRDTGIGLSQAQADRLFQPFAQADRSTARRYGGTGLGLAICKRLVELMDGTIAVRSTPGRGSAFTFTARFGVPTEGAQRLDLHRIRGMRTLVVDTQATERLVLQEILLSWRFQVGTAPFADDALHKLRRADPHTPYELLLVDWKTADIDFLHEARRIAAQRAPTPPAIVVLATMHNRTHVSEAIREIPTASVLAKPVTPSRLFDAIVRLQHGESARITPAAGKPGFVEALVPIRGARVLLVEDNAVNQQVAMAFLTMAGLQVTVVDNGREAVDRVKKEAFDVVLMDVQMPEMDGPQATRVIRSMADLGQLPIIAMTAGAMEEDKQECLAAGMNAHVAKPIDPAELVSALLAWVTPGAEAPAGRQQAT